MARKSEQAAPKKPVPQRAEQPETTPVSTPAKVVQLTPIVQPIAFVPYSTQEQPLYMYDDEHAYADVDMDGYYDDYDDADEDMDAMSAADAAPKKQVSVASIFMIIFSLLVIGIFVAAKWVLTDYLALANGTAGLDIVINMIKDQQFTNIMAICAAVVPVMCVLSIIACVIRIMHKGVCVFAQITSVIALIASLVVIVMSLVGKDIVIGYGSYAIAAICLINVLIALLSPKK